MRTYERATDRARRRARRFLVEQGEEIRRLRRRAGMSQAALGRLVGVSQSQVSRIEAGRLRTLSIMLACELLAAVGGELSVRAFAGAVPLHDAGQLRLFDRLRAVIHADLRLRREVSLGVPGDPRAFDAMAIAPGVSVAFELVARLEDSQAVERSFNRKLQDGRPRCLVLVLAASRHNRAALAASGLGETFDVSPRAILAALRAGRQPPGNGVILL